MAASPAASSRRSAASSSGSLKRSNDYSEIDTLVNHLLVAKRSLSSSMNHVLRANELATSARQSHQEALLLGAQAAFLRDSTLDQLSILLRVQQSLKSTRDWGKRDLERLAKAMDEVDADLRGTMDMLRETQVQNTLQPNDRDTINLLDFVDLTSVDGMREAMARSIDVLNALLDSYDKNLDRFKTDIEHLKTIFSPKPASPPTNDTKQQRETNPEAQQTNTVALLNRMDQNCTQMAAALVSLTKNFDMCVTAVRTTEGAAALARRKAAEVTQAQGSDGVSISGVIAEQESHMSDLEPKTAEDRAEMLKVIVNDTEDVNNTMKEIQWWLAGIQDDSTLVQDHLNQTRDAYASILESFTLLSEIGDRLGAYSAAEEDFKQRWELEKEAVFEKMREMMEIREFYEGYASAYGSLVLEMERRRAVDERVRSIWRKAQESVDKILDADRASREAFRQDVGNYLPTDLWAGMQGPARKWTVVQINDDESGAASMVDRTSAQGSVIADSARRGGLE